MHDIINYSTSICPFESGKSGKEEEKIQKFEYLENNESFLNKIKNIFQFLKGYHLVKKENFDKKIADTSLIVYEKEKPYLFSSICLVCMASIKI